MEEYSLCNSYVCLPKFSFNLLVAQGCLYHISLGLVMQVESPYQPWTIRQLLWFRFFLVFFSLYIFPFPLGHVPGLHILTQWYTRIWHAVVPWVGAQVLKLDEPITIFFSGSGDKTYDYVFLLIAFTCSLVAATLWTLLARQRRSHNQLLEVLRIYVRYYLGVMMLMYGMSKVFHLQMPSPSLLQLLQPLGDKSPMGLAWTYVGYSPAFSMFAGLSEVIGGMLLFFRRTTLLGALLVAIVMVNVMVMNFTFDIPVKLYATLLVLMAVFLIAPDTRRLLQVVLWNEATQPRRPYVFKLSRRWRIVALIVKIIFVGVIFGGDAYSSWRAVHTYGDRRPKPPLYGIFDVDRFVLRGDTLPPLTTDTKRWKQLILQSPDYVHVKLMNDSLVYYPSSWDEATHRLSIKGTQNGETVGMFTYKQSDTSELQLDGVLHKEGMVIHLRERDLQTFRLLNNRFRWIQEYPFNR